MFYLTRFKYPNIKRQITPYVVKTKKDLVETAAFYRNNAKEGWKLGSDIAKNKNRNSITAFVTKTAKAISKTRVRRKDIAPIVGAAVFSVIPFFGTWAVGFALGKAVNPTLTKLRITLKNGINKIRIK